MRNQRLGGIVCSTSITYGWLLLLMISWGEFSAFAEQPMFETGVIARSDPRGFVINAYPVIARLSDGKLLCVFAAETAAKPPKMKIAASTSTDRGKSWSAPSVLFDHLLTEDADPNLLV